ncbi:MAG: YkgJ family cysteine cluster protein [Magnetococcales bacterium]|nr:YkgJ family cysteine cluster protein [Magnetococcales bacterium]
MTTESVTHLCRHCSLCCNGILFSRVRILPAETKRVASKGMAFYTNSNGDHYFDQPCPSLRFGVCQIYESQPNTCRTYQCRLVKHVIDSALTLPEALTIVDQAIDLAGAVSKHLDKLFAPDWNRTYLKRLIRRALDTEKPDPQFLRDARKLVEHLDRYFDAQALLKTIPPPPKKVVHFKMAVGSSKTKHKDRTQR